MSAGRALVAAPFLPEFDRESGLLRVSHLIDMLQHRGWQVTFGCRYPPRDRERYARQLEQRGVETYAPLESVALARGDTDFDVAILAYWHVAQWFLPRLRQHSPSTRVIVDSVDLHFLREARERLGFQSAASPGQLETTDASRWIREINTYAAADAVLTVSEKEAALVNDLTGQPGLAMALPDAERLTRSPVPLAKRRGILFLGNFTHPPNRDAAACLCEEIVPRLDPSLLVEHPISVVGTGAEEYMPELGGSLSGVRTVGWVPSVLPYLNAARVSVVPLRYGAGTKRKVIQALMAGTPVVTTTVGAEGLELSDRRHALISDDPGAFADGIERLLRNSMAWRRLARAGRRHVLRLHGAATVEARFDQVLESALSRSPRPAAVQQLDGDGVPRAPEYARLIERVRETIVSTAPAGAQVVVATRGDDGFLALEARSGWHFPRDDDGKYAGYHPADSDAAIAHLEELRAQGATHFVLPETVFWWLAFYGEFHRHLDERYRRIHSDEHAIVYDLTGEPAETPAAVTADLIRRLRPLALPAASSYRNGAGPRRALVLGVYLTGTPNTAAHVVGTLADARDVRVRQRWAALGDEAPPGELKPVTALAVSEPTPKYSLLNRLLAQEDLSRYDFVLTVDDDVVLPEGFLDLFLGVQAGLGFDLAQPARTLNSHVDHPIVLQQLGVVARRTRFVEIGPVVSFAREIYDLVFPFDETSPMGWGYENVWSHQLRDRDRSQGIVDAVPVDHSVRKPVANYEWSDADAGRDRYLASHPHLPLEECFRVLEVIGPER